MNCGDTTYVKTWTGRSACTAEGEDLPLGERVQVELLATDPAARTVLVPAALSRDALAEHPAATMAS